MRRETPAETRIVNAMIAELDEKTGWVCATGPWGDRLRVDLLKAYKKARATVKQFKGDCNAAE